MKSLKLLVIVLLLGGATSSVIAQRTVMVYPGYGTVVTTLYQPGLVVHKGVSFHFTKGIWYKVKGRKYIACAAPLGVKVKNLPLGNKLVVHGGRQYYKYKGVFYKKKGRNYIIVSI